MIPIGRILRRLFVGEPRMRGDDPATMPPASCTLSEPRMRGDDPVFQAALLDVWP